MLEVAAISSACFDRTDFGLSNLTLPEGSNPHVRYNFTNVTYPTELSLEAFAAAYLRLRPWILSIEGPADSVVSYGQEFTISFGLGQFPDVARCRVNMVAPSFAMNQRLLVLYIEKVQQLSSFAYNVTVRAPPNANVAPPGYYMLFVVHQGVPCHCVWIRISRSEYSSRLVHIIG